jgi:predicted metal-binding membrane protein
LPAAALESLLKRDRLVIAASLAALFLLAWIFLLQLAGQMATMQGMAARMMGMRVEDGISRFLALTMSPMTAGLADTGATLVLVAVMWMVMMVGMMLPSAAPTILLFAALERKGKVDAPFARSALFTAGYFLTWGVFSIAAAAVQTALHGAGFLSMNMATTSALLAGGIFVLAGLFEFTPLKARCLVHCRSPLEWLPQHWKPGRLGALRMGAEHGLYCVGCCWMLMLLLFVGGVMNLLWVAVIAAIVLIEKLLPRGPFFARAAGIAFAVWGVVLIARQILIA